MKRVALKRRKAKGKKTQGEPKKFVAIGSGMDMSYVKVTLPGDKAHLVITAIEDGISVRLEPNQPEWLVARLCTRQTGAVNVADIKIVMDAHREE